MLWPDEWCNALKASLYLIVNIWSQQVWSTSKVCCIGKIQRFVHATCVETNLEISHSPIAEVDRVLRISRDCTRVTSNCTIKVPSLECFICLCFEALCLRWVACVSAITWTCQTSVMLHWKLASSTEEHRSSLPARGTTELTHLQPCEALCSHRKDWHKEGSNCNTGIHSSKASCTDPASKA